MLTLEHQQHLPATREVTQTQGLTDIVAILKRRVWLLIVPLLLATAIAAAFAVVMEPQYEAKTTIEIIDRQLIDRFFDQVDFTLPHKPFISIIADVIQTPTFLRKVIESEHVTEGFDVSNLIARARLTERVIKNLSVGMAKQEIGSDIITIGYRGRGAKNVISFVNAVAEEYRRYTMEVYRDEIKLARNNFKISHDKAKKELETASSAYQTFKEFANNFQLVGDQKLSTKQQELSRAEQAQSDELIALRGYMEQLDNLKQAILPMTETEVSETTEEQNPEWDKQKAVVSQLEDSFATIQKGHFPAHPKYKAAAEALEQARTKLNTIKSSIPTKVVTGRNLKRDHLEQERITLDGKRMASEARIDKLKTEVEALRIEVQKIPGLTNRDSQLRGTLANKREDFDRREKQLNNIESLWARLSTKEGEFFRTIRALDDSDADAMVPVAPKIFMLVGAGAFIGLLIGAGLAFVVEFSNRSFVTVGQVRRTLPLPLLGQVGVLKSPEEIRSTRRKRWLVVGVFVLIVLVISVVHVAYFTSFRKELPIGVFKLMHSVYGR